MNFSFLADIYKMSNHDILVHLGERFRDYRIALRLTQKEVSEQSGVSVMTIVRFERGEGSTIRANKLIALIRAIEQLERVYELIPHMPVSLYSRSTFTEREKRRVRKRKDEKK